MNRSTTKLIQKAETNDNRKIDTNPVTAMPTRIELDARERELLRRIVDGLPGMERVSVSAFQRRFYLGYARAAITMEQLQAFGVVDRNEDQVSWRILVDLATYRFPFEI